MVIYHEIVHAILYSEGMEADLHHSIILTNYVNKRVSSTTALYPNLPLQDAQELALFGLGSVAASAPDVYDQVAASYGLDRAKISKTGTSYRRDNVEGNEKKGTVYPSCTVTYLCQCLDEVRGCCGIDLCTLLSHQALLYALVAWSDVRWKEVHDDALKICK